MDWIESHAALASHPKTKRLARALDASKAATLGHLHLLWYWAARHALDGDLSRFDTVDIADAAEWDGDPDDFVKALIECGPRDSHGFLEPDHRLHDWAHHTEKYRNASEDGRLGAHRKWHVGGRKPPSADCPHCVDEGLVTPPAPASTRQSPVSTPEPASPASSQIPRSDGVSMGATMPPICDPNSKTRPDPTGPDRTGQDHHPPSPPAADATATTDRDAPRAVVVDAPPGTVTGTWRTRIIDPAGHKRLTPKTYTRACLDAIAAGHIDGDTATLHAHALADHMANERHEPVGSGAIKELRSLVLEYPPARVLDVLHDAVTSDHVDAPIGWTRTVLNGGPR